MTRLQSMPAKNGRIPTPRENDHPLPPPPDKEKNRGSHPNAWKIPSPLLRKDAGECSLFTQGSKGFEGYTSPVSGSPIGRKTKAVLGPKALAYPLNLSIESRKWECMTIPDFSCPCRFSQPPPIVTMVSSSKVSER